MSTASPWRPKSFNQPSGKDVAATVGVVFVAVFVLTVVLTLIAAPFIMLSFNHGVKGIIEACGGTASSIGYWTAFFTSWALTFIGGAFKGVNTVAKS